MNILDIPKEEIDTLQERFENAYPQEILRWAVETYGDKLTVVTSFQATGIATIHMLKEITDDFNVLTLDTGLLFPETHQLIDRVESHFSISVQRVSPAISLPTQAREHGSILWESDPDKCCHLRKTLPLRDALASYDAWIAGVRRDQSSSRRDTPAITWDERNGLMKLCPFINWTEDMIWTYIHAHELPYNTLYDRGYPSIGCYTCTLVGKNRNGRWANRGKTECGIHVPLIGEEFAEELDERAS